MMLTPAGCPGAAGEGDNAPFAVPVVAPFTPVVSRAMPNPPKDAAGLSDLAQVALVAWCKGKEVIADDEDIDDVSPDAVAEFICDDPGNAGAELGALCYAMRLNCTIPAPGGPTAQNWAHAELLCHGGPRGTGPATIGEAKPVIRNIIAAAKLGICWGRRWGPKEASLEPHGVFCVSAGGAGGAGGGPGPFTEAVRGRCPRGGRGQSLRR